MEIIIEKLIKGIQSHPVIQNSTLSGVKEWKRAHYIILSEIISDGLEKSEFMQGSKKNELGCSISSMTLQRIFKNDSSKTKSSDLRFLKSLDKLAIFIGYPSLNSFLNDEAIDANKLLEFENKTESASFFEKLIIDYCHEEFNSLKKLPQICHEGLSDFVFPEGPFSKRIKDLFENYSQLNYHLNCINNRSNFEIFDFKVSSITDTIAIITAKEFWNLEWKDENDAISIVLNKVNRQTYFIKKRDGIWKIWDNYNPDYNELSTRINSAIEIQHLKKTLIP
ncbi:MULTISPECIES: hypothetical protein [Flavobacterium]|jgi:hypothetical protein|uniref:DUF4440 domain-containing protein n=1 Tax=Flavobacterium cupriresistens TaxID=2893885 RepID=A0ABU4RHG0_9FLAO|nr:MULTISPECIES: hypothetical protein [unclassified Flavobacterium]KLT67954.1 hypothetical protein AB674_20210 [Flavobacterium sp. ABG]MDX6192029.1 hypothetical protein [Flavobacterium sp. Fl-318]UFH43784.1 hypothetical protein LNP23_06065 [Flavobacterium sp. F-323]